MEDKDKKKKKSTPKKNDKTSKTKPERIDINVTPDTDKINIDYGIEPGEDYEARRKAAMDKLEAISKEILPLASSYSTADILEAIKERLEPAIEATKIITAVINSETGKIYSGAIKDLINQFRTIQELLLERTALLPYIEKELENSSFGKLTVEEFADLEDNDEKEAEWNRICTAALEKYEKDEANKEDKLRYRTKKRAGITTHVPPKLALPSTAEYQYSLSFDENNNAYMQPIISTDGLTFEDGKMFFEGQLQAVSDAYLQNLKTKEPISEIDRPLLMVFYSIILTAFEKSLMKGDRLNPVITVYAPELAKQIGQSTGHNDRYIGTTLKKVQSFHNIVGIMSNGSGIYPILNFEGYDEETNNIKFSSPYINKIIEKTFDVSIRTDKKGQVIKKSNGLPDTKAMHSYLVKTEIASAKDKGAADNILILVPLIEQAGKHTPHISAATLIERNTSLNMRLKESSNPRQLLARTFKNTWIYLKKYTTIAEDYIDFEFPDENNPKNIPTPSTLETTVFEFNNKGKKKKRGKQQ